jgi:hypothetical protein
MKAPPAKKSPPRVRSRSAVPKVAALSLLAVAVVGGGYWAATNLLRRPPRAESIVPAKVAPGETVTISGRGFDSNPAGNAVRFGDQVGTVVSVTSTELRATVPAGLAPAGSASVPVVIETRAGASQALTLLVHRPPQVSGLRPDIAMPGDLVTITGENLDGQPLTVSIGGMTAEVKNAEPGTLAVVVPALPVVEGREVQVHVQIGPESSKPGRLLIGRLPLVTGVEPGQGPAGQKVVVKGRGFDAAPEGNRVSFGAEPAVVLKASATELTVAAPAPPLGETQAKVPVTVRANGSTSSSPAAFVLTRVSATTFVPRFFVTPVAEDPSGALAFVSTDLGPVLLLGGKDAAPSTAERALGVATALNALVAEAPTKAPVFELRRDGAPAVGVQGSAAALVTATAGDAAAYDRPWEGQRGQRGTSPRLVAQHWTALLQDYFTLFLLRQRPVKSLELSPRGNVFTSLYAETLRTPGAGSGVPTRLVVPPSATLAKGLRELALLLPRGAARAGSALEGLWEGSLLEGSATRGIKVRLRYEGSRLAGSLSTRAGRVEMNTPLKSVSFERGDLRFTVDIAGAVHAFKGTFQGEVITGSVQKGSLRSATGTFTLKLVE